MNNKYENRINSIIDKYVKSDCHWFDDVYFDPYAYSKHSKDKSASDDNVYKVIRYCIPYEPLKSDNGDWIQVLFVNNGGNEYPAALTEVCKNQKGNNEGHIVVTDNIEHMPDDKGVLLAFLANSGGIKSLDAVEILNGGEIDLEVKGNRIERVELNDSSNTVNNEKIDNDIEK